MATKLDLTKEADINKAITGIETRGAKLDSDIQAVGVAVLTHFGKFNDVRLVNRFYRALGKGARHEALSSWLLSYAAVSANADKETKGEKPFVNDKDKTTDPATAATDMWYAHKPSKTPDHVLDLQKAVRAILKKAASSTRIEHGDLAMLKAVALAAGIPESDVPSKLKAEPAAEAAPL